MKRGMWAMLVLIGVAGLSFAAGKEDLTKQGGASEKVFIGEFRGGDGVGRVFWIRAGEGQPDQTFYCDDKSQLITAKGPMVFSKIGSKEFIELFKTNEKLRVNYLERGGKKWVITIGPGAVKK